MTPEQLTELVTVPGATAAAISIAGFAKTVWIRAQAAQIRAIAAIAGVATTVAAQYAASGIDLGAGLLAGLNGVVAGLAASKMVEIGKHGANHSVVKIGGRPVETDGVKI